MKTPHVFEWAAWDWRAKTRDGINLMSRQGTVEDLAECYSLHASLALPYPKRSWRILLEMWRTLLSKGAMELCLVTNRAQPIGSQVVSFIAVVFVTDEFCSKARLELPPYLCVELVRQYLSSELAVLDGKQIAHANAGDGLNVMMCFEGWTRFGLSREQLLAVGQRQGYALQLALSGYHVKEFLADPVRRETVQWMLDAGAHLRRDYSNYFREQEVRGPEYSQRPCLVGLTKEEAFAHPGSNIAWLFIYTPPRFYFTRVQRVLLQHALMGETCETLARSLSLSTWTVKKYLHAIYDRVADIDKELLPPSIAYGAQTSSRGVERRRHLLNYLRQHLEEIRPYYRSKR